MHLYTEQQSPNGLDYFEEVFHLETGTPLWQFQGRAFEVELQAGIIWSHKGYRLFYFYDEQLYRLEKI